MTKFRLYFDKDPETNWLNEMAQNGYALKSFFAGFYTFEKCEPGEYIYQIDLGDRFFHISNNYREFMEETGVEIVQSWGYWIFMRKKASDGEFQLYTDVDSSIEHYTKIRNMFKGLFIIELICFLMETFATIYSSNIFSIFMVLIGILVIAAAQAVAKMNQRIVELKERKGEITQCQSKELSKPSPLLLTGLLFNCCAMAIQSPELHIFRIVVHIAAIALMIIGLFQSRKMFK